MGSSSFEWLRVLRFVGCLLEDIISRNIAVHILGSAICGCVQIMKDDWGRYVKIKGSVLKEVRFWRYMHLLPHGKVAHDLVHFFSYHFRNP